jgi:two-component sensor histidine kinase
MIMTEVGGTDTEARSEDVSMQSVAHELRTPLTTVLGVLSLLDDGSVALDEDEGRELVAMGRHEAEQMLFLVDNLLTRSRLDRGTLEADRTPIDLARLVREALHSFPDLTGRTFVPLDRDAIAYGDRRLVAQIVANLLQNVARYAPQGAVEIRFEERDDTMAMLVADEGPGIPPSGAEAVFRGESSDRGLGVGLGISREIARSLGGDLEVSNRPLRSGATLVLTLPRAEVGAVVDAEPTPSPHMLVTLPPSARLLVDMTDVLAERSLERLVAGINRMLSDLLDAGAACLVVRNREGGLEEVGVFGDEGGWLAPDTATTRRVLDGGSQEFVERLEDDEPAWVERLGAGSALFVPVPGAEARLGVLGVAWSREDPPSSRAIEIASAIGVLAGLGVDRAKLAADVDFERSLRSSVIESLPIAISVFTGDPPHIIDWNAAEEDLLGMHQPDERPANLAASQEKYNVRFLDGTPLDLSNAPVAIAIRTGASTGPFYLRVTRTDGTSTVTRTHCAPFFDESGAVAGAVVTSEEVDEEELDDEGIDGL